MGKDSQAKEEARRVLGKLEILALRRAWMNFGRSLAQEAYRRCKAPARVRISICTLEPNRQILDSQSNIAS